MAYDGMSPDNRLKKSTYNEMLEPSERFKRKEGLMENRRQERPMPMRSELVDNYFSSIMKEKDGQNEVYKELYRNVMDNRIFNNLKQQLNELISDEKSLIQIDEFKKMFFTFFKGESKAHFIYEKLLPFITVWNIGDKVWNDPSEM